MITQSELKEVLNYDPDTGIFTWIKKTNNKCNKIIVGKNAGWIEKIGYLRISLYKKSYMAHRLAWLYVYGEMPNKCIDHIDGNKSNNKISNLRNVTNAENAQNKKNHHSNSKTKIIGVDFIKRVNKFRATITLNYQQHYLGLFETKEMAFDAYIKAKRQLHLFGTL